LPSVDPIFRLFRRFSNQFFRFVTLLFCLICIALAHEHNRLSERLDFFFYLHAMPRRPPPTPLLLVQGPLPSRGMSKFTMPSVPRPIFHPQTMVAQRPVPRERVSNNRTGVAARESGWRVEGGRESPSPSTVGRGHIRAIIIPVDSGATAMPPKAAAGTG
jgi:hypothetical protein